MNTRVSFKRKWAYGLKNTIIKYSLNFSTDTIIESTALSQKYFFHHFRSNKTLINFKNSNRQT